MTRKRENEGWKEQGSPLEMETVQLQLLWGLKFWRKKATYIMYRNTLEHICSTDSNTNMKKLPSLPWFMASILLSPNCMEVAETLGSAYQCVAVADSQCGAGAAGGFALLLCSW